MCKGQWSGACALSALPAGKDKMNIIHVLFLYAFSPVSLDLMVFAHPNENPQCLRVLWGFHTGLRACTPNVQTKIESLRHLSRGKHHNAISNPVHERTFAGPLAPHRKNTCLKASGVSNADFRFTVYTVGILHVFSCSSGSLSAFATN